MRGLAYAGSAYEFVIFVFCKEAGQLVCIGNVGIISTVLSLAVKTAEGMNSSLS